ncbi:RHS repeat-associated core domain-containing protein [Acidovorax sp. SUPP3334]|uniref:RHS repeat-associated core domain-containing protein n=1 Tax=Acidovorax sp. SUPP3334 TaxID=2920881 RepID=UPI0023DE5F5C|nr:RHS repeat-associated core domain-containing protein [Acidovorax sp. SUPP3334]GKT26111.1 hypothetical protein AVHM3334_20090 [Acidovorax sp. SUPP3334]
MSYTYNALGQRVFKSDARLSGSNNPAITQQTVYAEDGIGSTVLGQYGSRRSSDSAAPAGEMDSTEVIYLPTATGPMPIAAQINGRLYAIDADHLNTPRRLTNTQGQVAWQWLITGFGEANPTTGATGYTQSGQGSAAYAEPIRFDLRYPGQVWDEETQLAYNLNRYYDQVSGRYIQADPIGLDGGWNRFAYVGGNPLNSTDPLGLMTWESWWDASVAGFQSETPWSAAMRVLEGWPVGASMVGGAGRYLAAWSKAPAIVEQGAMCVPASREALKADMFAMRAAPELKAILNWGRDIPGIQAARSSLDAMKMQGIQSSMTRAEIETIRDFYRAAAANGRGGAVAPERAAYMEQILQLWK